MHERPDNLLLTNPIDRCMLFAEKNSYSNQLLFRVVEIQRIDEATATPFSEGASLSE